MTFPDLALYLDHVIAREGKAWANDNSMSDWDRDLAIIRKCLDGEKATGTYEDEICAPVEVMGE